MMSKFECKPCPKCGHPYPIPFRNQFNILFQWTIYCDECGYESRPMPTLDVARALWNLKYRKKHN